MKNALGLRSRFIVAGALLVATVVATTAYSAWSFSRLSQVVDATVRDSENTTAAAGDLIDALEREDDALMLTAVDPGRGAPELAGRRRSVEGALSTFEQYLTRPEQADTVSRLRRDLQRYHVAANLVLATPRPDVARSLYYETVNPLLRGAVRAVTRVREDDFRSTGDAATWARDQARRSNRVLLGVSLAALLLSMVVSLHLATVVVTPIRKLTGAVEALRRGDFDLRVSIDHRDELGRLLEGFNRMADDLAAFRRANIGEVIRANETLEATLAALPDAVVVVGPGGEVSSANPRAALVMDGLHPGRTSRVQELPLPERTKVALGALLRGEPLAPQPMDFTAAIVVRVGAEERRLVPRIVPIEGGPARRRGAVLVLSDVTELARLDELRMELVAVVSHELRTPLTTLRMTLLMLEERGELLEDRDRTLVATALMGVEQLSTTIAEFLDLTQIEAGQLRLQRDRVEVERLLTQALRAIDAPCKEAGIRLGVEIGPHTPRNVLGDAGRLAVVLSNVLGNAVKYTPPGGQIRLAARSERSGFEPALRIEVTDTGPGVEAEFRERVFDKFFRVEHHRPRSDQGPRGSGIGLYVAREIVRAHGGHIACLAGDDRGGARFVISLPLGGEGARRAPALASDPPARV